MLLKRMYKPCFAIEAQIKLYLKKYNIFEKPLEINGMIRYTEKSCDMIAMKREVAAEAKT